jgi:hypothetical protein
VRVQVGRSTYVSGTCNFLGDQAAMGSNRREWLAVH